LTVDVLGSPKHLDIASAITQAKQLLIKADEQDTDAGLTPQPRVDLSELKHRERA
jgi:hypothetical protein